MSLTTIIGLIGSSGASGSGGSAPLPATVHGSSDPLTDGFYPFGIDNSFIKISDMENVLDHGAVGNGTTDDRAAFAAAISTGKDLWIPPGYTFLLAKPSGVDNYLTLQSGQSVYGAGRNSVIKVTGNGRGFVVQNNSVISGIRFTSDGKTSGNNFQAALIMGNSDGSPTLWKIVNCEFSGFAGDTASTGGGAIWVSTIASSQTIGGTISKCVFDSNNVGIKFGQRGEYTNVSDCKFINNNVAVDNWAGNNAFNNCTAQGGIGLRLRAGLNHGHSAWVGGSLNHCDTPFDIDGITLGFTFSGVMIYTGTGVIQNSTGIKFVGCDMADGAITLTNNTNLIRVGCRNQSTVTLVSGSNFVDTGDVSF